MVLFSTPSAVGDRITTRRGLGCSLYFAVTGAHPITPLDIVEATWLAEYPDRKLTTAELVGLRARSLVKHTAHVEDMRKRVSQEKLRAAQKYLQQMADSGAKLPVPEGKQDLYDLQEVCFWPLCPHHYKA